MLEAVDLNWFWQFICFFLAAVIGLLYLVRKSASRFFLLDSNFDSDSKYSSFHPVPIPTNMEDLLDPCLVCGRKTKNQCAACKVAKYCSGACQKSHWSKHKKECKDLASSYKANRANSLSRGRKALAIHQGRSSKILTHSNQILFPYEDFVKLFNWEKLGYPPCGLINCGNSCFANVVLQCLAYTRPLVAYLLEKGHRIECHSEDWCFFCEFQTHIERTSQSARPFSPINILSRLPNIGGNLGYGKQEDAHEFMRFAIDNMQSVCLDKFGGEKAVHPTCQETTLIQHIFGGRLQSQVICTECNNISNQFENMMDLTVEIHGDAESLEQCLDQFTAKEQLHGDNMYKCDGCNAYVMAWKRLLIQRAPNILTIALKRFQSGRFGKLNKKVSFPETLDLNTYMSDSGDGNDIYKLYAVIVHVDMLNASYFGHYICFVKDLRGSWYRIDDCKVESVELDEVLSQGAYMLLYNRISVRPSCLLPDESLRNDDSEKSRIEEINSSGNHPAECSSAPGHLESSVHFEQPSSASELRINSEEELSSILDAQDEKCSTSESNPVVKEVEIHGNVELSAAPRIVSPVNTYLIDGSTEKKDIKDIEFSIFAAAEDVNRGSEESTSGGLYTKFNEESHATNNETFEKGIGTCDGLSSVITDSTKPKIRNKSQFSVDIQDTVGKSDPGSAANVAPVDFTEMTQNSSLKDLTNGIERAVSVDIDLQEGEELSTAPEEISSISYTNRPVHTKTSLIGKSAMQPISENIGKHSLSASKVASQGNGSDPDESPGRIREESHPSENCTIEDDGRVCNNVSSSVIADVHIGDEMNTVNSSCGTKDSKPTAKRPDQEIIALKPIFSRGFHVKKRHADGNRTIKEDEANTLNSSYLSRSMKSTAKRLDLESSVKLKPILSPSPQKKFVESKDEVPANFRELAPNCDLSNKIDEVETPCSLGENGGSLKDAEKPYLMQLNANGKALGDSYICPSVENGDSCVHNLDVRDNGQTQSLITNVISNCSLKL